MNSLKNDPFWDSLSRTIMLRFSQGSDYLEIEVSTVEDQSLQSYRDAYVSVEVCSNRFTGHNDLWVHRNSLRAFCRSLINLEASRKGEAELESMSPDELYVKIYSVDSLGHVAVSGKTGYWIQDYNGSFWHSIEFGFTFDPSNLHSATKLPWVSRYAAESND